MENKNKKRMMQAKQLIQAQRYNEARSILITIDHPTSDKWLARLPTQSDKSFTGKLVLSIVLLFVLFIPGIIALSIFANEAKQHPKAPGAEAIIRLNLTVWYIGLALLGCAVIFMIMAILDGLQKGF